MPKLLNSLSLSTRIVGVTVAVVIAVVTVNYVVFVRGYRVRAQEALVEKAKVFTAVADEAKNHLSRLHQKGAIDTKVLAAELADSLAAGRPVTETKLYGTIPIVAGWTAAQEAAKRENTEFRITAFNARDIKNQPAPGSFDEQLLRRLTDQVAVGKGDIVTGIDGTANTLHVMRAIRLGENCLMCHGERGSSWDPDGDGKDVTGHIMEGWKAGDMHGSYHIVMPLAPVGEQVASFVLSGMAWTGPLLVLLGGVFLYLITILVRRPMNALRDSTQAIAEGDLSRDLPAPLLDRGDEIGVLARALGDLSTALRGSMLEVLRGTRTLAGVSEGLMDTSERISSRAKETSVQAEAVSAAAEESSVNATSVAAGMEQASTNLASVAAATEEMSATVAEIAGASARARAVGEEASAQAQAVAAVVQELGQAAHAIGKVTETITNISAQTNLLALNATIEAARAGAAGKGFAVVAHEIKELAQQTAKATEDIKAKVSGVQMSTGNAIADIEKIAGVIREVGSLVASIATSIEEQTSVTKDVAQNISQAAAGIRDANERISQTAMAVRSIAGDIATVSSQGQAATGDSVRLEEDANRLRSVTSRFEAIADRFVLGEDSETHEDEDNPSEPSNAREPGRARGSFQESESRLVTRQ
jgi:methyl-accepting chemotaxis protein